MWVLYCRTVEHKYCINQCIQYFSQVLILLHRTDFSLSLMRNHRLYWDKLLHLRWLHGLQDNHTVLTSQYLRWSLHFQSVQCEKTHVEFYMLVLFCNCNNNFWTKIIRIQILYHYLTRFFFMVYVRFNSVTYKTTSFFLRAEVLKLQLWLQQLERERKKNIIVHSDKENDSSTISFYDELMNNCY